MPAPATTDLDGRFRFTGLGRDRLATLDLSGPTIAFRRFQIVTRPMKRVENKAAEGPPLFDLSYHGADCTLVVEPGRPIEGVVSDAGTKEPIPGATVTGEMLAGSTWSVEGMVTAVTDAKGHYRLVGLPKGNGHRLIVYPPLDRPYFITDRLEVKAGPGLEPVRFDIALKRGLWITGKVSDATTASSRLQSAIFITTRSWRTSTPTASSQFPRPQPVRLTLDRQPLPYRRRRPIPGGRHAGPGDRSRQEFASIVSARRRRRLDLGAAVAAKRIGREAAAHLQPDHRAGLLGAVPEVNPADGVDEFDREPGPRRAAAPSLSVQLLDPQESADHDTR